MNHRMHIQTLLGVVPPWEPEWVNDAYKIHGWAPKRPSVGEHLARMQWEVQYGVLKYDPSDGQPRCSKCCDFAMRAQSLIVVNGDTSGWYCSSCAELFGTQEEG